MIETDMKMEVREITITDYPAVRSLWQSCQGICLHSDVDCEYGVGLYLARNPGLSFAAVRQGKIIGAVLCGQDGRRGYIHHLAVAEKYRRCGIGTALVDNVIGRLRQKGIRKCNGFVFKDNIDALGFWQSIGWAQRDDLKVVSKQIIL
jgi:ribosomal protein S18 acetylase RimI-like enzyme